MKQVLIINKLLAAVSLLFLGSCANSPLRLGSASPEELRTVPTDILCVAYSARQYNSMMWGIQEHRPEIRAELEHREVFTSEEWTKIDSEKVWTGMSRNALYCLLGKPNNCNRTVSALGATEQWVYGRPPHANYFYFQNDKLIAWQM